MDNGPLNTKKYSAYQIILAYLFGRYTAYRDDGLFQDTSFRDFIRMVLTS